VITGSHRDLDRDVRRAPARLAAPEDRLPGRLSACAMAVIGVLLLLYRES